MENSAIEWTDKRGRHKNHVRGIKHPKWNTDLKSSHKYLKIRVGIEHPLSDSNGYAYQHLVVWVSSGNPLPKSDEVIHHKNGDKTDNRIENLQLKKRSNHSIDHYSNLSDEEVREIRNSYASGKLDMVQLSKKYNCPIQRVSKYIKGMSRVSAGGVITKVDNRKKAAGALLDEKEHKEFPNHY